jgi:uncharacterized protein YPO0396
LQYIGELLDIPPEHRGWERAILTIIPPLASDLLVPATDFPAVRAWVNSHNLGGDITLDARCRASWGRFSNIRSGLLDLTATF